MSNIPHPAPSVNSPHDPDLNRFGLNPHSLIGYAGGSKMGGIEPTPIIEIVSNPDVYGVEHGELKMMKCGCPFSVDGSAPKGKGIAYKCSANGWFTFRCFDDSHSHPGSKYGTDNTGRGFYSYVIPVPNTNHVDVGHKLVAIEFNAADSDVAKALFGWTKESKISSTLMAANHKTKDNYVIFRADRLVGFKYESLVEAIPGTRINRDFKCDRRLTYRHNGIEIAVSDFSASDIPIAKPSAWSKLFVKAGLSECLTMIDPEPAPGAAAPKEHASVQEVKVDPVREVRLNFDKRIEKGAEAEAKKNFFYHMLEGYEGFECDPDDRRPIEEQVARAIHEAQDRVWEIRCRRAPEIAVTYNKCGVGHAIFSTVTCWQCSCRECRPFVLGSAASAIEVHLLAAFRSGSIISMYTMPLELHNRSSTKVLLSQWASSNDDPTINSGLLNNRETRVNSELPENDWIGVKNHREVVYFFCRNPDAGGNKKLVPAIIAKNGTPYRWGQITKESDILRVVSEVMAELQTQGDIANSAEEEIREMKRRGAEPEDIRAKEAAAPENLSGDLLFGPRVTISKLNTLRRAITGRGSSVVPKGQRAATKAEKARQKEVEGVEDYQVNVGYGIRKGVMKQISEDLVTTVTPENPTAGGLFPKNTKDRLHMNVPMTETVNKAAANGKYKKAEPGHRIGNNGRDEEEKIEIGTHAHGLTIVSVTEPVKELDDQLLDMGI